MKHARTDQEGFVALMSVVIISAVLIMMVFTLGVASFFARFNVFDQENKQVSASLAESCVHTAMLKIAQNPTYTGDEQITVDPTISQMICKICPISSGSGIILARAAYNGSYTNLRVTGTVGASNFTITQWREYGVNPVSSCTI